LKRVLFDENMPRKLRRDLSEFAIRTVQEEGWRGFENGNLLRRASAAFDVLVTADQRLRYQQNVSQFDIGIVVIETIDTRLSNLRRFLPQVKDAIDNVTSGSVYIVRTA
jgi:predicted nuclease of predicted toxin-antitoxin system